jgi:hypothetical protein
MANTLRIKRGTRAQLDSAASAGDLLAGELYLITDEGRIAVGTASSGYVRMARLDEIGGGDTGGGTQPMGLSGVLFTVAGTSNAWTQQSVEIAAYAGATVRPVFRYQNGNGFEGDIQLDAIALDGTLYSFEAQTHGFQTSNADDSATYDGVSWTDLQIQEDQRGVWQVNQGATPSNNTGRSDAADGSYYVYVESSSPADASGYTTWLRGPERTLGPAPTFTFFEARAGGDIGTLDVFLEVVG